MRGCRGKADWEGLGGEKGEETVAELYGRTDKKWVTLQHWLEKDS